mgnify:FL=1
MRTSQKKWERLSAVILTFALLLSMLPATAMAASTGDKSIDNEVHYQVNGAIDAGVRYWSIEYDKVDTDGSILLNGSKFADRSNQWGLSNTEPYAGRFLLNFHRVEFYEQIQGVSIVSGNNVTEFDKEANGALWTVPINTRTWASGKIGVVTNSQIRITLKNGQTLESLQLENTPISFETFAVTGSGNPGGSSMMVNRSWDQGFILANNQNRKDEQKTGFLTGPMSNRIRLDYNQLTGQLVIKSIHSFKPNVKMSTTDLYWVVYIKEQIPKELLPYIDTANIRLGATNEDGRGDKPGSEFRTDTPVTIDIDSNGLVDTSRVSAISIAQSDTRDALNAARNRLEKSVFSVATGQNANFTIQYPLRENVSIRDFAIFLNKYITEHDNQLLFDSWLESDYPNEKDGYGLVYTGTLDHGAPYKHLTDSYANAYIPMNDSDKDGLWDFIENQVGSNMNLVDTDGDGVPDGSELLDDSTDPVDAADYKAAAPQTGSTVLYGGIENTIEGTAPKLVYQDPGDKVIEVPVTSQQAGNALVKLQGYDDTTNTFTDVIYGSAVIPFDQLQAGNFRIDLAKDALTAVAGEKVVLVSYSPNGKNPAMGVPLQVLHLDKVIPVDPNHPGTVPDGYVTVTFDPGQGSWKDVTKPSSYYVQKDVEVTPADFQAVTDNLEAPADHIFSKWDGFPENGQFTADEQLTASFADSREIIEVTPKDPDQPFNPENADDGNNSQKTPQGFVRVIFESGEHGTFGTYAGGQDKVKVAYDVKAGQTWEKIAAPAVTAKPGYTAKSGAELWNPQLPGEAETVTGGTYTAQYTKNSGGKVLWYQEIYLQNPDGTFSRWSYGHGGFAKANTTVRMDLTAFDGQKTAWGDTLGVEYVFDADNAKNRLSDIVENAGKQTPLCAYYKRAPHTVTYQYEGTVPDGAPTVPAKVDSWYGANVSIAEPPTLAGYVFSGWTTDTAGAVIDKGILTMPNTDVVLKGIWTKDVATTAMVTFRIANGTWADGSTADKQILILLHEGKGTLDAADIPTGMKADSGYTGGTWDRQPDTTADAVTGNLLYIYSFRRDGGHGGNGGHGGSTRYTLTYVSNGGTEYKAERYSSGTTVKLSKTPVREGYHFTGWYADKNLTDKIDRIQMTKNKTVYAGWEKNASELHIPDMLNGDDHFAYVAGYTDGTVRPNAKITRAEVAMIFYRLLDEDVRAANETDSNSFSDVTNGMWFNTAVSTIARLGIVKGRSAEIFDPNAPITRAEFATVCARFDHSSVESDKSFFDIHGHWAETFIEHAAALGWVNGYIDGTFHPNATITRAEAMAMINRVLGRLPESEKDLLSGMKTWPDNADPSAWYYLTVQEATNSHSFERKEDGVHERWIKLK